MLNDVKPPTTLPDRYSGSLLPFPFQITFSKEYPSQRFPQAAGRSVLPLLISPPLTLVGIFAVQNKLYYLSAVANR